MRKTKEKSFKKLKFQNFFKIQKFFHKYFELGNFGALKWPLKIPNLTLLQ